MIIHVQESMETNMLTQNRFCTFVYFAAFFILFFCDVCHVCEYNSMIGEDKQRMTFSEPFLSPPSILHFHQKWKPIQQSENPDHDFEGCKRGTAAQLGESDRFMYKPLWKVWELKKGPLDLALGNIKSQEA